MRRIAIECAFSTLEVELKGRQNVISARLRSPELGSLYLTHSWDGEVKGLKDFPADQRPPVPVVYFAFRIIVGVAVLMLTVVVMGLVLMKRGTLDRSPRYLRLCQLAASFGFIAVIAGWTTTEVGRQPWTVYGLLRTADSVPLMAGFRMLAGWTDRIEIAQNVLPFRVIDGGVVSGLLSNSSGRIRPLPGRGRARILSWVHPAAHALIGHQDPALGKQILDVAETQGEPDIKPDRLLDNFGREAVAAIAEFGHRLGSRTAGAAASPAHRDIAFSIDQVGKAYGKLRG